MLNVAMFGKTAKQWKQDNPDLKGNMRDYATINQLICLSNMENLNSVFINDGMKQSERLEKLNKIAIQQMKVLENIEDKKMFIEKKKENDYMNYLLQKNLPDSIFRLVDGKSCKPDNIGMSGSKIMIFEDSVLKIVPLRRENDETIRMMKWLEGKIPVPKVIAYEKDDEYQYLLMSRVSGKMSCDKYYLEHPKELLDILAKALKMLWNIDVSDCPRSRNIEVELSEAKYRVENNLVDMDNVEPTTFGKDGFENPRALLNWLYENKPDYEPVLSHGDFCLPNIFIEDGRVSGFIDLGDTGIGDKWRDIALCYRSLKHNFDGSYGGKFSNGKVEDVK